MKAPLAYSLAAALAAVLGACAMQTEATAPLAAAGPASATAKADPAMEADAAALYASLTPDQRTKAALAVDDPRRAEVKFPGGPRAGILLRELDEKQRALALKLLTGFTSDYGRKQADQIVGQAGPDGYGRYFVAFFGEPKAGTAYAWRIAEHHLTLVDVEVAPDQSLSVGPILLGSNPPDFFEVEEEQLIGLYAALTPEDKAAVTVDGTGASAEPIVAAGAALWKLSPATQAKVAAVVDQRLGFYSKPIEARIRAVIEERGGLKSMHMAFYGTADKRCKDGGKWDWKLGGPTFLIDYENTRGHIHMSLRADAKRAQDAR
jgi:hypothetical protein